MNINPNYNIPAGLGDALAYEDTGVQTDNQNYGAGGADLLYPPTTFTVVEQELHYANDGSLVVDVVVEVEDIPGVVKFDVRIAKVNNDDGGVILI